MTAARRGLRLLLLGTLLSFGLLLFPVGLLLHPGEAGPVVLLRPWTLLALSMLGGLGTVAVGMSGGRRREAGTPGRLGRLASRILVPALLATSVLLPLVGSRYDIDLGVLVLTYVMLGWGLNIVVGLAGLLDLGYVAFYAVGAYGYALLAIHGGLGFWTALPLAGLLASLAGTLLGFPVLRLRGDYLAIVTLAFGEIIRIVITNWTSLTGGPNGLGGIPRPTLFGLRFSAGGGPDTFSGFFGVPFSPTQRVAFLYYVILALALLTNAAALRLRRLPLGRAWEALREDEIACRALGIDVTRTKLTAFAIGAGFGGIAGAFFATRQAFISPESFTFIESATVLAIVVLGGLGSQLGVALAAMVMIGGLELLRNALEVLGSEPGLAAIGAITGDFGRYRMLLFGLALVAVMAVRPRGLVGTRRPTVSLGRARDISAELVAEGRG